MKFKDLVDQTVKSGIEPILLQYDPIAFFESSGRIIRSFLVIESLELGTLTYKEYRFIARRTKQGNALVKRHIEKLFRAFPKLLRDCVDPICFTIPVYARLLKGGELAEMLMQAFSDFPDVSPSKICIELSADILYEDIADAKQRLKELRDLGVKLAICEVGDEFCPVFRLAEFDFDYAFVDEFATTSLDGDGAERIAGSLVKFLSFLKVKVLAPGLDSEEKISAAETVGFDGYGTKISPAEEGGGSR